MKKSFFLLIIMALSLLTAVLLSSCNNGGSATTTTTPNQDTDDTSQTTVATDDTTTPETTAPETTIIEELSTAPGAIVSGGISDYVIVYNVEVNSLEYPLAVEMRDKIKALTGVTLRINRSSVLSEREIVIGYMSDRPECDTAYDKIATDDYIISVEGNRIILGAYTEEGLQAAVATFVNTALTMEGNTLYVHSYRYNSGGRVIRGDIASYSVVYPTGADDYIIGAATAMAEKLSSTFGVKIEAVPDTEVKSAKAILVGNTNRTIPGMAEALSEIEKYEFVTYADDDIIAINANTDFALYAGTRLLCDSVLGSAIAPANFAVREGIHVSSSVNTSDAQEVATGADIRVMSYNLLHESWSNVVSNVPVSGRAELFACLLYYYMPDVIGIQEISASWHSNINKLVVADGVYAKACEYTGTSRLNMTTFLYNTKTVRLVESYVTDLDSGSDIRVFAVAVFEKLSDGSRFVVTNCHPAPTSQSGYERNISSTISLAKETIQKYDGLPVIMTGDFNSKETSSGYKRIISEAPVVDCKFNTEVLVRNYNSFLNPRWLGSVSAGDKASLDHLFINSNASCLLFNTIIDNCVESISDHIPIYADIQFK